MTQPQPQLELEGITRRYGALLANDNVSLRVERGTIHALLGENGAGKSTLVHILYGMTRADAGQIRWQGEPVEIDSPRRARRLGIGMVFQHFALFDTLTVAENIALGMEGAALKGLPERIDAVARRYRLPVDPHAWIADLSAGEKQRVEIIRCLLQEPRLLILDEPTSVLAPVETERLFETLRQLAAEGRSILFIGHKLEEIRALCDAATILRGGRYIAAIDPRQMSAAEIARQMVGGEIGDCARAAAAAPRRATALEVGAAAPLDCAGLRVKRGCITGVAGIAGNGQDALMDFLGGETPGAADALRFNGQPIGDWDARRRNAAGIALAPTERLGRAAVPALALRENGLLGALRRRRFVSRAGLIDRAALGRFAADIVAAFGVATPKRDGEADVDAPAAALSGGNLQKFIIGRAILQRPQVLLVSNPTWGVDVKASLFIRNALLRLRDEGVAILVASEDLEELFLICDEIAVMRERRLSESFPIDEIDVARVGEMMVE